ncbi:MAG UNVERIFIED_CONTAM: hypothetical protein LVT10_26750 [Anaerolineae bacterium]
MWHPPHPATRSLTLLDSAAQIIHEVDTFQMEVNRTGAAYFIPTILGMFRLNAPPCNIAPQNRYRGLSAPSCVGWC